VNLFHELDEQIHAFRKFLFLTAIVLNANLPGNSALEKKRKLLANFAGHLFSPIIPASKRHTLSPLAQQAICPYRRIRSQA
jgi:hypothetical protein